MFILYIIFSIIEAIVFVCTAIFVFITKAWPFIVGFLVLCIIVAALSGGNKK